MDGVVVVALVGSRVPQFDSRVYLCQGTKFHPKLDSGASAITPGGISLIFKAKKSTLFSSRLFYGI